MVLGGRGTLLSEYTNQFTDLGRQDPNKRPSLFALASSVWPRWPQRERKSPEGTQGWPIEGGNWRAGTLDRPPHGPTDRRAGAH